MSLIDEMKSLGPTFRKSIKREGKRLRHDDAAIEGGASGDPLSGIDC